MMKPTDFMNINDIRWTEVDDSTIAELGDNERSPEEYRIVAWVNHPGVFIGPKLASVYDNKWVIQGIDNEENVTHFMWLCTPEPRKPIPPNVFYRDSSGFESSDGKPMSMEFYYCWRNRQSEFPKIDGDGM